MLSIILGKKHIFFVCVRSEFIQRVLVKSLSGQMSDIAKVDPGCRGLIRNNDIKVMTRSEEPKIRGGEESLETWSLWMISLHQLQIFAVLKY